MSEELRRKQSACQYFKLDEWGICTYQYNFDVDTCKGNCLIHEDKNMNMSEGEEAFNQLDKEDMKILNDLIDGRD